MAGHSFFGKQKLCCTEVSDFTDYQGIGHDPMYKRYDSVFSVVKRVIPINLQHFLATPEYMDDEDQICWHIEKWQQHPTRLSELSGAEYDRYKGILDDTIKIYKSSIMDLSGEDLQIMAGAIKYVSEDRVYCTDDKVYLVAWGMTPDVRQHKVVGSVIHDFEYTKKYKITFDAGEHGTISKLDKTISRAEGSILSKLDIPTVDVCEGWNFTGWIPSPIGQRVNSNMTFTAQYDEVVLETPAIPPISPEPSIPLDSPTEEPTTEPEDVFYNCRFEAGGHGSIEGSSSFRKAANTTLSSGEIPIVTPNKGYKFTGWNISPNNILVDEDKVFFAQYEKTLPWYKRWWLWFAGLWTGKGCLKWLLWLLLIILLIWLLSWLLKGCGHHSPVNGVVPIDTITRADGSRVDDNGAVRPITGSDGKLPDDNTVVAPVMGEGGEEPPIVKQPGVPNIIANRLFLYMENENDNVDALARDFKQAYPDDKYSIIGYDKEVKLLVIQIPENERDQIRKTINSKIPNHKFIVFDEEVYELHGQISNSTENAGWHLNAIHLKQGWTYTKGSSDVKVAIVDDGIQASHPMFKGRIVDAYNVFTQNNALSLGEGHGTHTAGLAVGSADYFSKGASGVAPNCQIMPIQVFDNKQCPLSALIAGVMYALHHDADVVNISIGPSFKGLNVLPVEQQAEIAKTQFQNVAFLWARVCKLAAKKNTILVFAAGNDDILTSIPPENRNASSIVVTAVDKRLYPTVFTNYGPCSDISAPGKGIYSSFPSNTFQSCDGTSMAAPIVTGTIALMKSLKKDITVAQARNVLYKTGADVYGYIPPMVLVDKALMAVKNGDFSEPTERKIKPVPEGEGDESAANRQQPIVDTPPSANTDTPTSQGNETDYDAIRRKIAEYKQKIEELERLLPQKR